MLCIRKQILFQKERENAISGSKKVLFVRKKNVCEHEGNMREEIRNRPVDDLLHEKCNQTKKNVIKAQHGE